MTDLILKTFVAVTTALVTLAFWSIILSIIAGNLLVGILN